MFALGRIRQHVAALARRGLASESSGKTAASYAYLVPGALFVGAAGSFAWSMVNTSSEPSAAAANDATAQLAAAVEALSTRLKALEATVAGKTNSAFVFIKPHACNATVIELVRTKLAEAGIRVTGEGELDAATIDKNMLIDNHYGAIASKAVKLKPAELNVPAKGKADFQKLFNTSWEDALSKGLVFNASDACTQLGVDGFGLEKKWSQLSRGVNLIKFGGGLYAGGKRGPGPRGAPAAHAPPPRPPPTWQLLRQGGQHLRDQRLLRGHARRIHHASRKAALFHGAMACRLAGVDRLPGKGAGLPREPRPPAELTRVVAPNSL